PSLPLLFCFFFFKDTAPTQIYTLSLHDALPIWWLAKREGERLSALCSDADFLTALGHHARGAGAAASGSSNRGALTAGAPGQDKDRKSTRLNSSHDQISYAVFCLKKKKNKNTTE